MKDISKHRKQVIDNGFSIAENIYSTEEIEMLLHIINQADTSRNTFRKSSDLFAIRQFLSEVPACRSIIFNDNLRFILKSLLGDNHFSVKSIYFDKPQTSNWYVAYHQDLTISVDKKLNLEHYGPWTTKQNQFAVQPPIDILQNVLTIRIHLDDTDGENGSLKVIPKSHLKGIYRPETINWTLEKETNCVVPKGGIMLMKPLLLHRSGRTVNDKRRRVIHIEFSNQELPTVLNWSERINLN